MEVKLEYSLVQLDSAAEFISKNNPSWRGEVDAIKDSIKSSMMEIVEQFPHLLSISTIGYTLIAHILEEDLDEDENSIQIEILVDPAIGESEMNDTSESHEIYPGL